MYLIKACNEGVNNKYVILLSSNNNSFPLHLCYLWHMPSLSELILLLILGISSNLILFFMLKAFALTDAIALAPYRYIELIISAIVTYVYLMNYLIKSLYGTLILNHQPYL